MEHTNGSSVLPQTQAQDNVAPTFTDAIIQKVDSSLSSPRAAVAPPNRRFAEVYWDGEAWQVILWESHEAQWSKAEQEFSELGREAQFYISEWTEFGKVRY